MKKIYICDTCSGKIECDSWAFPCSICGKQICGSCVNVAGVCDDCIKPCPFCGGSFGFHVESLNGSGCFRIGCDTPGCFAEWVNSVYITDRLAAIKQWNKRK